MNTPGDRRPSSPRFVLVDLAGTLIAPDPSVAEQYRQTARDFLPASEIPPAATIQERFRAGFTHLDPPAGELRYGTTRTEGFWFWKRMVGLVFVKLDNDRLQSLTEALFERFARADAWRILPGSRNCLDELGRRGVQRGLISNWDARGRSLAESLRLDECFESMAFSSEEGLEKPDRRIFQRIMDRLDVSDPASGLMVGNHPARDLDPARDLGMRTCLLGTDGSADHPQVGSWESLQGRMSGFPDGFG